MVDETSTIWVPPGPVVQMVVANAIHQMNHYPRLELLGLAKTEGLQYWKTHIHRIYEDPAAGFTLYIQAKCACIQA